MNPRLILAVAVALFLRWLATGHVTVTIARTPVTLPALAVAGTVVTITALATAAIAIATARAVPLPPTADPGQESAATSTAKESKS
jgi:hypothetical protein